MYSQNFSRSAENMSLELLLSDNSDSAERTGSTYNVLRALLLSPNASGRGEEDALM